ncbi:MAG: LamG-like jellyroll fold domain-containing protein [Spirochaetota bacterium]
MNTCGVSSSSIARLARALPLAVICFSAFLLFPPCAHPSDADVKMPKIVIGNIMLWSTPGSKRFQKGYITPAGEAGGFYENAPLLPIYGERTNSTPGMFRQIFIDANKAGIDVIEVDCFEDMGPKSLLWWAEEARRAGTDVKICIMMDRMDKKGADFLAVISKSKELLDHPFLFKVAGRPLVISFGYYGADVWKERIARARAAGGDFCIINDLSGLGKDVWNDGRVPEKALAGIEATDGIYNFAGNPSLFATGNSIVSAMKQAAASMAQPKMIGASVRWGYISSTRVGNMSSPMGTRIYRHTWLDIMTNEIDLVHLTTLNDYSETEMECSANTTFTFNDLNAYFGARWKTGVWPKREKPQAFLSYRKAVVADEPSLFELVLLVPNATDNASDAIARRYSADVRVRCSDGSIVTLEPAAAEPLPGHLCWNFSSKGISVVGFGIPSVRVRLDGKDILVPRGALAPFAIVRNGESVARKWLHVPLHRIASGIDAALAVATDDLGSYPRRISISGVPWKDAMGGLIELNANPLTGMTMASDMSGGFTEAEYDGPGYQPIRYEHEREKRVFMDEIDRYTAVIRMNDDTFVFPSPVQAKPPRTNISLPVDTATIMDFIIEPGTVLIDRGHMHRDVKLPSAAAAPGIERDGPEAPWHLRFDGVSNRIALIGANAPVGVNPMCMPPGPVTIELRLRPRSSVAAQTIFASIGAVANIKLQGDMTLEITRMNEERIDVVLPGRTPLVENAWSHVVVTFNGRELALYVNGKPDGTVSCLGLRTEERSFLGGPSGLGGFFSGDIGMFRVLQRSVAAREVEDRYSADKSRFGKR